LLILTSIPDDLSPEIPTFDMFIKKSYIKTFLQEQGYHVSHSTMEHGYKKAVQLINSDPDFQNMVKRIQENDN